MVSRKPSPGPEIIMTRFSSTPRRSARTRMLPLSPPRVVRTALALALVTLAACGDDPVEPSEAGIDDFVGVWTWNVVNINSSCGTEEPWEAQVTIARVGASTTQVTASSAWRADGTGPFTFAGTVNGNTLTIPGVTYTEQGGTLTAQHQVVLQNNGNLAGEETWTWTDGTDSCTGGTADILAVSAVP